MRDCFQIFCRKAAVKGCSKYFCYPQLLFAMINDRSEGHFWFERKRIKIIPEKLFIKQMLNIFHKFKNVGDIRFWPCHIWCWTPTPQMESVVAWCWLCVYSAATDAGVKVHTVFGLLQAGWSTVAVEGGALGVRYQLSGTGAGMPDPCRVFVTQSDFYYTNPRLLWTKHNT